MYHVCVNAGLHASAAMGLSGRLEFDSSNRRNWNTFSGRTFFVVEGVYIQQGRKRTSEHHPRGKGGGGGGGPPRLIIDSIRIAVEAALNCLEKEETI
jgi:hypothetical protein